MSTRNIHVNTASYTILVAGREKNTGEEWDVLEFSSLTELKKYRKSHPEKMAFSYSYALSRGVDTQFRHINIAEADHFKQFLRQIKRAGEDIPAPEIDPVLKAFGRHIARSFHRGRGVHIPAMKNTAFGQVLRTLELKRAFN